MKKLLTKTTLAASVALLAFGASAETATFNAGVTVQNAFTFQSTADLDFGTIRATADTATTDTATLVLAANPATSSKTAASGAGAEIAVLTAGTPASFSVSGVSPFATLTIDATGVTGAISPVTAPAGTAGFTLSTPTYYVLTGANPNSAATTAIQVDSTGAATFNMGATLTTDATTPSSDYIDGDYSGTFTLILDY
ncbi:hypothetical protein PTRA_a0852 [Pseudoalteromonas translucida KMM 520]|uniref:DUF4402 domain-containing protein n=1 Tax=Pseudoalteromonas translucida KMM 520 TaxID=1315283 RepID=A0A0U2V2R2_9GAMM|nr:DUF4402 domain-containing protein [Pseudoalteromonas translucida]ALS32156.1 hypothetical protein PTRA_a0852 [Pseudoalteromonas translucida KMM 520]